MPDVPKVSNGRTWLAKGLLQTLLIVAMALFIVIDKAIPRVNGDERAQGYREALILEKRIATLEECVLSLRPLPYDMAAVKTSIQGIEKQIDKIEKKLDSEK